MQEGLKPAYIAKLIVGGLLIGAGVFLSLQSNKTLLSKGTSVPTAHADITTTYCASWQATKLLTVNTTNLPGGGNNLRKVFAIGPAEWTVNYTDGAYDPSRGCLGSSVASETWDIPTNNGDTPNCYTAANYPIPVGVGNPCQGKYLFALVGGGGTQYQNMKYSTLNYNDNILSNDRYLVNNSPICQTLAAYNDSFVGPGALAANVGKTSTGVGCTGGSTIQGGAGWFASGTYGWTTTPPTSTLINGTVTTNITAGLMMPLEWNVSGTIVN